MDNGNDVLRCSYPKSARSAELLSLMTAPFASFTNNHMHVVGLCAVEGVVYAADQIKD
jgi:hypothetical protein